MSKPPLPPVIPSKAVKAYLWTTGQLETLVTIRSTTMSDRWTARCLQIQ